MEDFLNQVDLAANTAGLYFLALAGALVIPDICGALESPDGITNGARYIAWFIANVAPKYSAGLVQLSGEDCYRFRCSFLHQGTTVHPKASYTRIIFLEPGGPIMGHMNILNDALNLDIPTFCHDMTDAARNWMASQTGTEPYESNRKVFVTRYPEGLAPYAVGMPVIS